MFSIIMNYLELYFGIYGSNFTLKVLPGIEKRSQQLKLLSLAYPFSHVLDLRLPLGCFYQKCLKSLKKMLSGET